MEIRPVVVHQLAGAALYSGDRGAVRALEASQLHLKRGGWGMDMLWGSLWAFPVSFSCHMYVHSGYFWSYLSLFLKYSSGVYYRCFALANISGLLGAPPKALLLGLPFFSVALVFFFISTYFASSL